MEEKPRGGSPDLNLKVSSLRLQCQRHSAARPCVCARCGLSKARCGKGRSKIRAREAGPFCHRGLPPDYLGLARTAWDARTNKASKRRRKSRLNIFQMNDHS